MSRKLYVGNIPYETNEQDLQELFAQAGAVETVTVMRDRDTGWRNGTNRLFLEEEQSRPGFPRCSGRCGGDIHPRSRTQLNLPSAA